MEVDLPVKLTAELVVKRRNLGEINSWLTRNGDTACAGPVRETRIQLLREELERILAKAEALLQTSKTP